MVKVKGKFARLFNSSPNSIIKDVKGTHHWVWFSGRHNQVSTVICPTLGSLTMKYKVVDDNIFLG